MQNRLHTIQNLSTRPKSPHPLLNLGFRAFFLGAAAFAALAMLMWLLLLQGVVLPAYGVDPFVWHGRETVFGYALAVVAGFLLTAVKTWTNRPMPYGYPLLAIFAFWGLARVFWLVFLGAPNAAVLAAALVCETLFWGATCFCVIKAVTAARQKRQIGVALNLLATWCCLGGFYAGVFLQNAPLQQKTLLAAFYLLVAMIFLIGRRVLPFFIERGVKANADGSPSGAIYRAKHSAFLDKAAPLALFAFAIGDVFLADKSDGLRYATAFCALAAAATNAARLLNWYHKGIWQKPLLWSLYVSFWAQVGGLLLFFASPFLPLFNVRSLALHVLALGGVGLTTLAMMARVALGHTGRNIHAPPKGVVAMFALMLAALAFRAILPLFAPSLYAVWLFLAQAAWILAFGLFLWLYGKILTSERVDGLFG